MGSMAVMHVFIMANHANDDIALCRTRHGHLVAILILLMIFTLGDTVHLGLVQRIDLVLVPGLLGQYPLIEQKLRLKALKQASLWQLSS